jgi:hypothetical protein
MSKKSSLTPNEAYEVSNIKIENAPKDWRLRIIVWGGRKYLPTDD